MTLCIFFLAVFMMNVIHDIYVVMIAKTFLILAFLKAASLGPGKRKSSESVDVTAAPTSSPKVNSAPTSFPRQILPLMMNISREPLPYFLPCGICPPKMSWFVWVLLLSQKRMSRPNHRMKDILLLSLPCLMKASSV